MGIGPKVVEMEKTLSDAPEREGNEVNTNGWCRGPFHNQRPRKYRQRVVIRCELSQTNTGWQIGRERYVTFNVKRTVRSSKSDE